MAALEGLNAVTAAINQVSNSLKFVGRGSDAVLKNIGKAATYISGGQIGFLSSFLLEADNKDRAENMKICLRESWEAIKPEVKAVLPIGDETLSAKSLRKELLKIKSALLDKLRTKEPHSVEAQQLWANLMYIFVVLVIVQDGVGQTLGKVIKMALKFREVVAKYIVSGVNLQTAVTNRNWCIFAMAVDPSTAAILTISLVHYTKFVHKSLIVHGLSSLATAVYTRQISVVNMERVERCIKAFQEAELPDNDELLAKKFADSHTISRARSMQSLSKAYGKLMETCEDTQWRKALHVLIKYMETVSDGQDILDNFFRIQKALRNNGLKEVSAVICNQLMAVYYKPKKVQPSDDFLPYEEDDDED